jgi:oligoribonuclease NrnB/cAMP/cGMP phosphodiesterase (DHH superfamily)
VKSVLRDHFFIDGGQHRNAAGGKSDVSMAEIQKNLKIWLLKQQSKPNEN